MSKFYCWWCELWYGPEDAPEAPSQLCPACKEAMARPSLVNVYGE